MRQRLDFRGFPPVSKSQWGAKCFMDTEHPVRRCGASWKAEKYRFALKGLPLWKGKVEEIIIQNVQAHADKHLKEAVREVMTAAQSRLVTQPTLSKNLLSEWISEWMNRHRLYVRVQYFWLVDGWCRWITERLVCDLSPSVVVHFPLSRKTGSATLGKQRCPGYALQV